MSAYIRWYNFPGCRLLGPHQIDVSIGDAVMFAPPVAKLKSSAPQRSAIAAQRPNNQAPVAHRQLLQRTVDDQAMFQLRAQSASVTRNKPGTYESKATPAWDFSKAPIFSSIRRRACPRSPSKIPRGC